MLRGLPPRSDVPRPDRAHGPTGLDRGDTGQWELRAQGPATDVPVKDMADDGPEAPAGIPVVAAAKPTADVLGTVISKSPTTAPELSRNTPTMRDGAVRPTKRYMARVGVLWFISLSPGTKKPPGQSGGWLSKLSCLLGLRREGGAGAFAVVVAVADVGERGD